MLLQLTLTSTIYAFELRPSKEWTRQNLLIPGRVVAY